jgi:4-hydroxy-tetrahydrodipicolinate reductase
MIQIGLLGAPGRMGQTLSRLIKSDYSTVAQISAEVGRGDSMEGLLESDVVIDFSSPRACLEWVHTLLKQAQEAPHRPLPAVVVGTTGLTSADEQLLRKLGEQTPVLMASNFSTGVSALARILEQAAPLLQKLGYTPVLVETHHSHKKDAPSGTALSLKKTLEPPFASPIPIHSIRAGEVIGEHEVHFYGKHDRIILSHLAQDRCIFASGAIQAALWLAQNRNEPTTQGLLTLEHYFHALTATPAESQGFSQGGSSA